MLEQSIIIISVTLLSVSSLGVFFAPEKESSTPQKITQRSDNLFYDEMEIY